MPRLLGAIAGLAFAGFFLCSLTTEASTRSQYDKVAKKSLAQLSPKESRDRENWELLNSIEQYKLKPSLVQINSVDKLQDISPTDWSYEALRGLVERYNCLTGFPDATYRGNQAISRAEFAAGLNACLNRIESLLANSNNIDPQEIDTILKLMQEFQADLALLQGKTDGFQARINELEVTQFSNTTKLKGEAIFGLASLILEEDASSILGDRIRLELETSFSGKDLLFTRLSASNFSSFSDTTETFAGNLAFSETNNNNLNLEVLFYSFNLNENTNLILGATGTAADDIANTVNILDGDGASGAISLFGTRNPIYLPPGDTGLGIIHRPLNEIEISAGYLAGDAEKSNSGNGLFNGSFSALGQVLFSPTNNLNFAATYIHSYNQSDTETGSQLANLQSFTAKPTTFDKSVSTVGNSYGLELSWAISDRVTIGGWGALSKVSNLSTLENRIDLGTQDIWNWAATLALPDLGKEGSIGGVVIGMEPSVSNSSINNIPEDKDSSFHFEAFYQYKVNDNIAITPGVVWITAPDNNKNNDDLVIGTIRTTFSF